MRGEWPRTTPLAHYPIRVIICSTTWLNMARLSVVLGLVCVALFATAFGEDEKEDVGTVIGIDLGTTYSW